jgi:hypothetical protein
LEALLGSDGHDRIARHAWISWNPGDSSLGPDAVPDVGYGGTVYGGVAVGGAPALYCPSLGSNVRGCFERRGVLLSMVTSFATYILPGLPAKFSEGSYGITTLHAFFGAVTLMLGVFVTLRANGLVPKRLRFTNYKLFMRTAYALYMLATLGGVVVYVIVFVYGI